MPTGPATKITNLGALKILGRPAILAVSGLHAALFPGCRMGCQRDDLSWRKACPKEKRRIQRGIFQIYPYTWFSKKRSLPAESWQAFGFPAVLPDFPAVPALCQSRGTMCGMPRRCPILTRLPPPAALPLDANRAAKPFKSPALPDKAGTQWPGQQTIFRCPRSRFQKISGVAFATPPLFLFW